MASQDAPRKPKRNILGLTLRGLEELQYFPNEEARIKALDDIGRSFRLWETVFAIVVIAVAAIAANIGLKWLIGWLIPVHGRLTGEILDTLRVIFVIAAGFLVMRALHRWGVRKELRQRLIAAGVPTCESCGYLLRGLDAAVTHCPECGNEIGEHVRDVMRAVRNES